MFRLPDVFTETIRDAQGRGEKVHEAVVGIVVDNVDPMKMASIEGFLADPEGVTEWYDGRRTFIAASKPNAAHRALASATGMVHITQNIDRLLEKAGAVGVVHLHGHIDADHCLEECGYVEEVDPLNPRGLRTCQDCGALLRPSIVLFGEMLPEREWMRAHMAVVAADVLLVIGTSAEVYPAAGLIALARDHGAKVIVVNLEESWIDDSAEVTLHADVTDAEQVQAAVEGGIDFINPKGFNGKSCYTGGCKRPFHRNGCGGMDENQIVF